MEREIPRGEPWILPFVRHGHHAHRVDVPPVKIADGLTRRGRFPIWVITLEPQVDIEQIDLLGPQQSGKRGALDVLLILAGCRRMNRMVELIRLGTTLGNDRVHFRKWIGDIFIC